MVGFIKGFVTFAKKKNSNIISTHCFLHRESLISKTFPATLKLVLNEMVNMVNYIKSRSLKTRFFKKLCMKAQYKSLLLHIEIKWLFRGKILMPSFRT